MMAAHRMPIRDVGAGESMDALRQVNASDFVHGLS
jgi:hypothetical protein